MATHSPAELLALFNQTIMSLDLEKEPALLYQPIRYTLSMGGKRLRPVLCLMACELFDGSIQQAIPAALALEVFHNFTLLHDDIMDKAEKRRNCDCVHVKWNNNIAILSGDAMSIMAFQQLNRLPDPLMRQCLEVFAETAIQVCEGQQFDMDFETTNEVSETDYLNMIQLKTGVLLAASLKIGAMIGKAPAADAERLYQFGVHTGIAFQLQDDFLDVYGDSQTLGKKIGGDIVTNKKTYLLIQALRNADAATRAELLYWLNEAPADPEAKIKAVTAIFDRTHVKAICQEKMEQQAQEALKSLEAVKVDDKRKEKLKQLAMELTSRTN
jgi:geranylgeranyl diphosphate synthase type II